MSYQFLADFPFFSLKVKVKLRRYDLMQTKTRRQALLWLQKPYQKELQIPQHKLSMLPSTSGRTPGTELGNHPGLPESKGTGYP